MTLADLIIDGGRWNADGSYRLDLTSDQVDALRDELLELRQRRQADEERERYDVYGVGTESYGGIVTQHSCGWTAQIDTDDPTTLAELNRRADQHGEECR